MTTTNTIKVLSMAALAGASLALVACGDDMPSGPTDSGVDAQTPEVDSGMDVDGGGALTGCAGYCTQITTNCTGDNAQYASMTDCMETCAALAWPEGTAGDTSGNTIQCRIYHGGAPAASNPGEHCPHAGASGAGVCGASITFRTDAPSAYTRVDRMGMPAVSTALIPSGSKDAYNDADPSDDAAGTFVGDILGSLTTIHTALDDDLAAATLTPCSMTIMEGGLPQCVGQEIAPGVQVADLVLPDTLQINPAAAAGFPNGRRLADPVIDVTLSVILLDMGGVCGVGMTCSPTTLVSGPAPAPLNPPANDVAFLDTFPYLAPAHTP